MKKSEAQGDINRSWLDALHSSSGHDGAVPRGEPRRTERWTRDRPTWDRSSGCPMHPFSLVVCRHPETGLWLAVEETGGRGWWLPGGFVDPGDDHPAAAVRETREEAGVDVTLRGVLRVENEMTARGGRQRVVYYAEPTDPAQRPKTVADDESVGAAWLSVDELLELGRSPPPGGLRGAELLEWARYIEGGGTIYPLDVFATEDTPVPDPSPRVPRAGRDSGTG